MLPFSIRSLQILALSLLATVTASADVFLVPNPTSDAIVRVNAAGAKSNQISTGLDTPEQVVADSSGNLYVADSGLGKVLKYPAAGGAPTQVGDAVPAVKSLAFDSSGVLHVACSTDRTIRKLNGATFQILATLSTATSLGGIAFDSSDHLFVADSGGIQVFEVTPAGGQSVFSNDVTTPFGAAFDTTGKLHVSDAAKGGRIVTFNPNGKSRDVITGVGAIRGLGFDRTNTIYFLTSGGDLDRVSGNSTVNVASGLGDARLLTVRAPTTRVIAYKTQTLTDPNGGVIATMNAPAIGGGAVAFKGTLLPPLGGISPANALGIWRDDGGGTLASLARKGKPAPGLTNEILSTLTDPVVNHNGKVAFAGSLLIGTGDAKANNAKVVFSDATGPLAPVLRGSAPGLDPAIKFTAFKQIVLADDAGPAALATIAGPTVNAGNNLGLWSVDAAGVGALVVRKGDMVTFPDKSRKITALGIFKPTPFALGQGRHFGDGRKFVVTATFSDGYVALLLVQPGTSPVVLATKKGLVGPALNGTTFASFGSPCVSADPSFFAFLAKLTPNTGTATTANAVAVFTQQAGTNTLEAQKAFPAPTVSGAFFATLGDPVMNAGGGFAFLGKMKPGLGGVLTSDTAGIWADYGPGLGLIARQGRPAPGISGTVKFTVFKQLALPDTGGVVFTALVAGTNITAANNLGLWADDGAGGVELILRKGDQVSVKGQKHTVTAFTVLTSLVGVTGQSRSFDASGAIALSVICSDGTRAILAYQRP